MVDLWGKPVIICFRAGHMGVKGNERLNDLAALATMADSRAMD